VRTLEEFIISSLRTLDLGSRTWNSKDNSNGNRNTNMQFCLDSYVDPCLHGTARPRVADGGNGLQIWRVAANMLVRLIKMRLNETCSEVRVGKICLINFLSRMG
jgi:hypothetical protein